MACEENAAASKARLNSLSVPHYYQISCSIDKFHFNLVFSSLSNVCISQNDKVTVETVLTFILPALCTVSILLYCNSTIVVSFINMFISRHFIGVSEDVLMRPSLLVEILFTQSLFAFPVMWWEILLLPGLLSQAFQVGSFKC